MKLLLLSLDETSVAMTIGADAASLCCVRDRLSTRVASLVMQ